MKEKKDMMISFFGGFLPSSGTWLIIDVNQDFTSFLLKVLATVVIGAAGGFAGILGKDIYKRLKSNFLKQQKQKR